MVIQEAAFLGTPVLTTRTISAEETVGKKGFGWVCDNSEKGIIEALQQIAKKPSAITDIKKAFDNYVFDNSEALSDFYKSVIGV